VGVGVGAPAVAVAVGRGDGRKGAAGLLFELHAERRESEEYKAMSAGASKRGDRKRIVSPRKRGTSAA
jgi:hypothetical protein